MEKKVGISMVLGLAFVFTACNFVDETLAANTVAPAIPEISRQAATSNHENLSPSPTLILVAGGPCPPFALDSLALDFESISEPSGFIHKHYDGADWNQILTGYHSVSLDDRHEWDDLRRNNRAVQFLDRLVCKNYKELSFYEVEDALILNLEKGQSIARHCWQGSVENPLAFAVGSVDLTIPRQTYHDMDGWLYNRLDAAYRIDLAREKFVTIPPENLECVYSYQSGD
jgi:hypothetical protein